MIAKAVPSPAETRAPVLQWVRMRARSPTRLSPCLAMAALAAASAASIARACAKAASAASRRAATAPVSPAARRAAW